MNAVANSGIALARHAGNEGSTHPTAGQPIPAQHPLQQPYALVHDALLTLDAEIAWSIKNLSGAPALVGDQVRGLQSKVSEAAKLLRGMIDADAKAARVAEYRAALDKMDRDNREREATQEILPLVPRQSAPAFANKAGAR